MRTFSVRAFLGSALLAALAAGAAAQSEQHSVAALPDLQRMNYGADGDADPAAATVKPAEHREWPQLSGEGALDGWEFGDARHEILPNGPKRVLAIFRESDVRIEVPLQMTFRDTPQLRLNVVVRGEGFVLNASLASGETTVGRAEVSIGKAMRTKHLVLNFPSFTREQAVDRLILELPAGGLPVGFEAMAIEDMPLGDYPPQEAFRGITLVNIGADARRARCIEDGGTGDLFQTLSVTRVDQELRFSYGLPGSLRQPGALPVLALRLTVDGEEDSISWFEFDSNPDGRARWNNGRLKLGEYVGQDITLRFSLFFPSKAERPANSPPQFALLGEAHLVQPMNDPPSVLLVTSSSLRADHVGYAGSADAPATPFLDSLASEGLAFVNASASTNGTLPSHIGLLTGRSAGASGVVARELPLATAARTLAQVFSERGYATLAVVSDRSLNSQVSGLGRGFDRFGNVLSTQKRSTQQSIGQLKEWMADFADQPLFVWLHTSDSSGPYSAPEHIVQRYYPEALNPYDPASPVASFGRAPAWDPLIADPMYTEALYDAAITNQDQLLGRFVNAGRFARGWIAWTADHGETLRKGGPKHFSHRGLTWGNLIVPLVFRGPGLAAQAPRKNAVQQSDVGRSLLQLAGLADADFPGTDLLGAQASPNTQRFAIEEGALSAALIEGDWMLRVALHPLGSSTLPDPLILHRAQLFDLTREDHQQRTAQDVEPERRKRMRAALMRWLQKSQVGGWSWVDPTCDCNNCRAAR